MKVDPLRVFISGLILVLVGGEKDSEEVRSDGRQLFNFFRPPVSNSPGRPIENDPYFQQEKGRSCTTPNRLRGLCLDITDCPTMLLDLGNLIRSICFKKNFRPGTCCPTERPSPITTSTSTTTTTTATTTTPLTTTKAPPTTKKPITKRKDKITTPAKSTTTTSTEASTIIETTTESTTKTPGFPLPWMTPPGVVTNKPPTSTSKPKSRIDCGVQITTQARIVNGTEAYPGKWPWMAAIYLQGILSKEFHCGGTIISKRYIMTAAHCMIDKRGSRFGAKQFIVRLGDHDISTTNSRLDRYAKDYRVKSITIHPDFENFSHQYFKNDLALLELTTDIDFSPFALPVCLPSKALAKMPTDGLSGTMATAIGYGRTSYNGPQSQRIMEARMPVWWNQACDDAYFPPILESNVCAGYVEGGIDSCQGDSGGPLLIYRNGRWIQLGIVSFGQKCAEPGYPGVYTRVPKFLSWIRSEMRRS